MIQATTQWRALPLAFLTAILFLTSEALAQDTLVPVCLVTVNGDTLTGELDQVRWAERSDGLRFKPAGTNHIRTIAHEVIAAIFVSDAWHVRRTVTVDEAPLHARLEHRETPHGHRNDSLYLTVLVDGPLSLYTYRGARPHYYVETEDGLHELVLHEVVVRQHGRFVRVREEPYKEQIQQLQRRCPAVSVDVDGMAYDQRVFSRFVAACGEQVNPGSVRVMRQPKQLMVNHVFTAGWMAMTIPAHAWPGGPSFSSYHQPSLGYHAQVGFRGRVRESMLVGIQVRRIAYEYEDHGGTRVRTRMPCWDCEYQRDYVTRDRSLRSIDAAAFLLGRYRVPTTPLSPFVDLGASVAVPIHFAGENTESQVSYSLEPGPGRPRDWQEIEIIDQSVERNDVWQSTNYVSLLSGIGVEYRRASLAFRFERVMGPITGQGNDFMPRQLIHLMLGYAF